MSICITNLFNKKEYKVEVRCEWFYLIRYTLNYKLTSFKLQKDIQRFPINGFSQLKSDGNYTSRRVELLALALFQRPYLKIFKISWRIGPVED